MATHHTKITREQADLIRESKVFFIASVDSEVGPGPDGQGPVNLSPKGNVPLCIIDENQVAYLDYHGSGNETARHADSGGPVTVMVMSMQGDDAAIVRLYGCATVTPLDESPLAERLLETCRDRKGLRQIVTVDVEHTQTSCGYGVPVFEHVRDRRTSDRGRRFK
jgi:hypothetical protein